MKTIITTLMSLMLIGGSAFQVVAFADSAVAAPPKNQDDVLSGLFTKCEKSFAEYNAELAKVKAILKGKYSAMSQEKIDELSNKSDAGLNFLRINFPDDLKGRDLTITIYKDCAGLNAKAREVFASKASTAKERQENYQEVHDCVSMVFTGGRSVVAPFDKMLACYQKHIGN